MNELSVTRGIDVIASSQVGEPPASGGAEKPRDYLNAVLRIDAWLTANELLGAPPRIEQDRGQIRDGRLFAPPLLVS